jgi:hypothetical protein
MLFIHIRLKCINVFGSADRSGKCSSPGNTKDIEAPGKDLGFPNVPGHLNEGTSLNQVLVLYTIYCRLTLCVTLCGRRT